MPAEPPRILVRATPGTGQLCVRGAASAGGRASAGVRQRIEMICALGSALAEHDDVRVDQGAFRPRCARPEQFRPDSACASRYRQVLLLIPGAHVASRAAPHVSGPAPLEHEVREVTGLRPWPSSSPSAFSRQARVPFPSVITGGSSIPACRSRRIRFGRPALWAGCRPPRHHRNQSGSPPAPGVTQWGRAYIPCPAPLVEAATDGGSACLREHLPYRDGSAFSAGP